MPGLPAILALLALITAPLHAQKTTYVEFRVGHPKAAAIERVLQVLADSGVQATSASEAGLVTGEWTDGPATFYLSAVVSPIGPDSSRVHLSVMLNNPILDVGTGSSGHREFLDSGAHGDGKKAWEKLERIAYAISVP